MYIDILYTYIVHYACNYMYTYNTYIQMLIFCTVIYNVHVHVNYLYIQ